MIVRLAGDRGNFSKKACAIAGIVLEAQVTAAGAVISGWGGAGESCQNLTARVSGAVLSVRTGHDETPGSLKVLYNTN